MSSTGGVGAAFARIADRRSFVEHCALADYDIARSEVVVSSLDDDRFSAHAVDASSQQAVADLICATNATHVMNAVDPVFNVPSFEASFAAGVTYMDMAMTLSEPHPTHPFERSGVKLGDYQFERAAAWEDKGQLAVVGMGIEPGAADVFARFAADELFSEIDEVGIRDGANLVVEGYHVVDNEWSMRECGSQAVVWQTALNPVCALELLAEGAWSGAGVLGPEAFPAQPFLDKLAELDSPHGMLELTP